jgi:asparagine synthase (glutamine-hydrolysing)
VQITDGSLVAAVDRARSIPIFYAHTGDDMYVSDDAYWVAEQLAEQDYDKLSIAEFLLAGYVTGQDTLFPMIKQLRAGELLLAKATPSGIQVTARTYYAFLHGGYITNFEKLLQEWDKALLSVFSRLIHSVNGRPIVIPLSGGKDSRLVAIMLKRLRYENVICLSYGLPGNRESEISKQVALRLGYRWEFVPYSRRLWYDSFHSKEYRAYERFADGLASIAHIQDWPAVWEMKAGSIIPEDSVFVPGHGGDVTAGGHIPTEFGRTNHVGEEDVLNAIISKYYNLWDIKKLDTSRVLKMNPDEVRFRLKRKIHSLLGGLSCETPEEAANALEQWNWRERQTKFIANSVRAYEFWGYDWRLPYWDKELLHFWQRVPLCYRLEMRLRKRYTQNIEARFGIKGPSAQSDWTHLIITRVLETLGLLDRVKALGLPELFDKITNRMRRISYRRLYESHPLGWYGIIPIEHFGSLYQRKPENINSLLALARLGIDSF